MKRALLSVTDKTGIVDFARGLSALGVEILSTGGTKRVLDAGGIETVALEAYTGMPEMLDGRVKTLHPKVHAGLLARRDLPEHMNTMAGQGWGTIDILAVNLYDFAGARSRSESTEAEIIEAIDIGGPTLLRAAAKNYAAVIPIVDPRDYEAILASLGKNDDVPLETRRDLAAKVFEHTAAYDRAISTFMHEPPTAFSTRSNVDPGRSHEGASGPDVQNASEQAAEAVVAPAFDETIVKSLTKLMSLRYGENPHQGAAFYRELDASPWGLAAASVSQGKVLSYNNLLDLDAAFGLALDLGPGTVVFIKHNNPCGVAKSEHLADAIAEARACDSVSAFGSVVALFGQVDGRAAQVLTDGFVEACIAPEYTPEALEVLGRKKNLRVVTLALGAWRSRRSVEVRTIRGGFLLQEADDFSSTAHADAVASTGQHPELAAARVVTARAPSKEELAGLSFAWMVAKHVRSNAIVFARQGRTVAVGAGQMSRIDSVKLCRLKAASPLEGTVAASDAFFPFRDGLDVLAEAGATAVIQPGGSVRDEEVVKAADEHGVAMLFTGTRHFRH
ncbi:MAG: bifunctional phosphoribosylaminoimidazolecarboxamide formyltransferase/IMP cyclohydrolase [Deltaproteobacteria bacterium]|nr:bifunctional phosphoribosylaminoimidazolecarboxamide formyltransferase/IMP cyclohydrolase [Deltaproteobacteria bacterium]